MPVVVGVSDFRWLLIPHRFRRSSVRGVNHGTGSRIRVRHQMAVYPEREPRIGVPQVVGQRSNRHSPIEQDTRVVVSELVHPGVPSGLESGGFHCSSPHRVVIRSVDQPAIAPSEHLLIISPVHTKVLGERNPNYIR